MKHISKRRLGHDFVEAAGIQPLLDDLISIDKKAALKMIVKMQSFLKVVISDAQKKRENHSHTIGDQELFEIIKDILDTGGKYRYSQIKIGDYDKFNHVIVSIINMSLAYLAQLPKVDGLNNQSFFQESSKMIDMLGLIMGHSDEMLDYSNSIKQILLHLSHKSNKKTPKARAKNLKEQLHKQENKNPTTQKNTGGSIRVESKKGQNELDVELLTWYETMELFKISTATLRRWEQAGSIPKAIRMGGRVYFSKSEILDHINRRKHK